MRKGLFFGYGVACYLVFLGVFLYLVGFVGDFLVPRTVDAGPETATAWAVVIDLVLMGLFGVQHSVMARPEFKRWWTRVVPEPIERSTYVLVSSLTLALVMWGWRPIDVSVWRLDGGAWVLWGVFALGWVVLLVSTFLIDHFDLFGLKQVYVYLRGREAEAPTFRTPGMYRFVRHPLMLGFILAFWATPEMTAGHLLFAGGMSAYIVVGTHFEERDLARTLGEKYRAYRERVPRFIPRPGSSVESGEMIPE